MVDSDSRPPGIEQNRMSGIVSRDSSGHNHRILSFPGQYGFAKECVGREFRYSLFSRNSMFPAKSAAIRPFQGLRTRPPASWRPGNNFYKCWAQAPPPEFLQFCCSIQSLLPKVWLYRARAEVPAAEHRPLALQFEVAPKLKLHLSAFSSPLESNQAFRSGSEIASSNSCDITFAMPSAPPTPV